MTSTPTQNVRLTISVTPEVHATFQRLSKTGGTSISKAMGDWLGDTIEAANYMAQKMEEARAAPKVVMRELHAYALGLADEIGEVVEKARVNGYEARRAAMAEGVPLVGKEPGRRFPPSGNTGGKGQKPQSGSRS